MQITTKFNIGQELYLCTDLAAKHSQCYICNGTGKITYKYETFTCPKCQGNNTPQPIEFRPKKVTISKIRISVSTGGNITHIKYTYIDEMGKKRNIPENKDVLFQTLEEAENKCMELNKEATTNED